MSFVFLSLETAPRLVLWRRIVLPFAGAMLLGTDEEGQGLFLSFLSGRTMADALAQWQKKWPRAVFVRNKFDGPVPQRFALAGTELQIAVWRAIAAIPYGESRTYADIARAIKKPTAVRSVGTACGANPVPIVIPCHRVVASDGTLGGFNGSLTVKKRLLASEGLKKPYGTFKKKQSAKKK